MKLLTENDYKILTRVFHSDGSTGMTKLTGVTVKYLSEKTELSPSKIRMALSLLIEYGFIELGISKGRERTYYLTQDGFNEIKLLTKTTILNNKGE